MNNTEQTQLNKNNNHGGRPKLEIDFDMVKRLAAIHCTEDEIANVLGISVRTLQRNKEFCRIYKKGLDDAKASLRRLQWMNAERGSVPMQIWLGKQYLGQKDTHAIGGSGEPIKAEITQIVKIKDYGSTVP